MGLGYQTLEGPLQALNIVFPIDKFENPRLLFGKNGLDRIMNYDESIKKNFSYKPAILKKYGRIFSQEHIHKYSNKISTICKAIKKSKGIVLIYSQYINGGCLPLALALEEMGFTRHGGKSQSLFKTPPEIKTPFKYIMITGDINLSPKNSEEINFATNEDNINGEKIKVIIISKAGSEGLDSKNIRQIHILDPWYNTNRIEQIIGRGIRTCSHRLLPFEERNCQIFLYGTLLTDDSEAADLYTYRLAEKKAIKIGIISRILKENAIDCILNKGQRNMTEEKINQTINIKISNGKEIEYKVGDKPFTAVCDYMSSCDYKCNPTDDMGEINYDTYNDTFIVMNLDKILSRIKNLMKEFYVYKKNDLIMAINSVKKYPDEQINIALEKLTSDKHEIITDRFGRTGYLINIGEYYMFQPIELENENISMYERTHPLDYKREKLLFSLPKKQTQTEMRTKKVTVILNNIKKKMEIIKKSKKVLKGEWHRLCFNVIHILKEEYDINKLYKHALHHLLDVMSYKDKVKLINYLYLNDELDEMEKKMKQFFDSFVLPESNIILLVNGTKIKRLKWDKNKWENLTALELNESEKKILDRKVKNKMEINNTIGLIYPLNEKLVYKIKKRDGKVGVKIGKNGLVCAQKSKKLVIEILNELYKKKKYSMANTRISAKKNNGRSSQELCVEQELLLRYFNDEKKNGKIWFFSSVDSIINKNI